MLSIQKEFLNVLKMALVCVNANQEIHSYEGDLNSFTQLKSVNNLSIKRVFFEEINRFIQSGVVTLANTNENIIETQISIVDKKGIVNASLFRSKDQVDNLPMYMIMLKWEKKKIKSDNEEFLRSKLTSTTYNVLDQESELDKVTRKIGLAVLFLDKKLKIIKYTSSINQFFKLDPINRISIEEISQLIRDEDLAYLCKDVIHNMSPLTIEVQNNAGIWLRVQIYPDIENVTGDIGIIIYFTNIHNQKIKELDNKALNGFLKQLLETNPAVLMTYNVIDKKFTYVSGTLAKLAGYNWDNIYENKDGLFKSIVHPEDLSRLEAYYDYISTEQTNQYQIEYRILQKNSKKTIWLLSTSNVYECDDKGNPISVITSTQNITQTKQIQEEFSAFANRVQGAFESSKSILWEWSNNESNKIWCSSAISDIVDIDSESGRKGFFRLIDLIHPEDRIILKKQVLTLKKEESNVEKDIRIRTNKGEYHWFKVNAKLQTDKLGGNKIVGILSYINERKEIEVELREVNKELEQFAFLASHDLKEPLYTIIGFIDLFKNDFFKSLDITGRQYIEFIEGAGQRMVSLINDILNYAQLDREKEHKKKLNLNKVVAHIIQDLDGAISDSKAKIEVNKLPSIYGYSSQIRQLFQNLLSNSLKYRSEKRSTEIEIGYTEKDSFFEFYIKDNGIGINPKYHETIFKVFKRLHNREKYEGNGIGLANCKKIIQNHDGEISLDSTEGEGAIFYFTIPIATT